MSLPVFPDGFGFAASLVPDPRSRLSILSTFLSRSDILFRVDDFLFAGLGFLAFFFDFLLTSGFSAGGSDNCRISFVETMASTTTFETSGSGATVGLVSPSQTGHHDTPAVRSLAHTAILPLSIARV